jgi:hypothetical protein
MSLICRLGLHDWVKKGLETETNDYERGACVETWEEEFKLSKCAKCGAEKKKIHVKRAAPHGVKSKQRKLVNREWKDEVKEPV